MTNSKTQSAKLSTSPSRLNECAFFELEILSPVYIKRRELKYKYVS